MPLDSLYELLLDALRDIYHAEHQLLKALPKLARFAQTPALRSALESHRTETEHQMIRLERAFAELGVAARAKRCKGMEGLVEEGEDLMEAEGAEAVLDAALIASAQKIEHYQIAAYTSMVTYAELLGEAPVAAMLRLSLEEEKAADNRLSQIAEADVNSVAVTAGTGEETGA